LILYNKKALIRAFFDTLEPDQQADWLRVRKACDASLFYFVKDIGSYAKKAGGDISPIIHKPIADWWISPDLFRGAVFMPRIWRKSTVFTQWGNIREYLLNNEIRILIASEKLDQASKWLKWMEEQILNNRRLRWVYPELSIVDRSYTKSHAWSGDKCLLPREGVYPEMTFNCVGIRGSSQGGHHDIIHCDDLVGERGMESATVLEDAMRWFDNIDELLIQSDTNLPEPSKVRIVGTHWATGDFGCYVQDKYREYEWRIVPALNDPNLKDHDQIKYIQSPDADPGESNWPEVWTTDHFIKMKANPEKEMVYYTQYQNNPGGMTGGGLEKFDKSWLRYFHWEESDRGKVIVAEKEDGSDGEKFVLADVPLYGCIDPGGFAEIKAIKKGSRNVILIGGQPRTSIKKFIVFTYARKMKHPSEFLNELFEKNDEFKPRAWSIDTIGPGQFMYATILEERSKRHKTMPIFPFPVVVTKNIKDDDIQSLIPPGSNGEIYIHSSMKEFISEWGDYPNGMTKDLLDMAGKLCKARWSRHVKQKDIDPLAEFGFTVRAQDIPDGRSPVTGY
jgi:hypothetical protein